MRLNKKKRISCLKAVGSTLCQAENRRFLPNISSCVFMASSVARMREQREQGGKKREEGREKREDVQISNGGGVCGGVDEVMTM